MTLNRELDRVTTALESFEAATGVQVCFRPIGDRWNKLGNRGSVGVHAEHRSDFCMRKKAQNLAACTRCDNHEAFSICSTATDPFVRTCRAGADELLVPIWVDGSLSAIVFLGQFVVDDREGPNELPRISASQVVQYSALLEMLRSYLLELLAGLGRLEVGRPQELRATMIREFIRETLPQGPRLSVLAPRLGLSVSRAGHVVREVTGSTFHELVERERIGVASELLAGTGSTVGWVAAQTGFRDVGYFCRYFKSKTGSTPGGYRRQHARRIPV